MPRREVYLHAYIGVLDGWCQAPALLRSYFYRCPLQSYLQGIQEVTLVTTVGATPQTFCADGRFPK